MAVSVRDVAGLAGVSLGTVSNVLNSPAKVSEATARRVLAAIDELGFVRNDAARQLRAGSSRTLGLVVLDVRNPFFTDLARGAEIRAAEQGLTVLLANSDGSSERERRNLDLFEQNRVRGVLLSPVGDVEARVEQLRARGVAVVLVDRVSADHTTSVSVDDEEGGRLATQHLVDIGRRRIAFIGGPLDLPQVRDRLLGAQSVVDRTPGVSLDVIATPTLSVLDGREAGRQLVALPREHRPDAVFAANDLIAVGVMQALPLLGGVRIPDDVALIGYDDIDFAQSTVVPLSSVRQPSMEIGRRAVDLLVAAAAGAPSESVVLRPELVVRDSTLSASTRPAATADALTAPA